MKVNTDNVVDGKEHNFDICDGCSNQALGYDFDSLMHYTNDAFAKKDDEGNPIGKTIEVIDDPDHILAHTASKHTFSPLDLKGILDMYDCTGKNLFMTCNTADRK